MDRIWQWAWDRYGARYSWAIFAVSFPILLTYLFWSFVVVAFEQSDRYVEAAGVTVVAVLVLSYAMVLPGLGRIRLVERWAAGHKVDRTKALEATYAYARGAVARAVVGTAVWTALLFVVVGGIAGATGSRLVQYALLGAVVGISVQLVGVHSFAEETMRPARVAIGGDTGIGDALPPSRPSFAAGRTCPLSGECLHSASAARC